MSAFDHQRKLVEKSLNVDSPIPSLFRLVKKNSQLLPVAWAANFSACRYSVPLCSCKKKNIFACSFHLQFESVLCSTLDIFASYVIAPLLFSRSAPDPLPIRSRPDPDPLLLTHCSRPSFTSFSRLFLTLVFLCEQTRKKNK